MQSLHTPTPVLGAIVINHTQRTLFCIAVGQTLYCETEDTLWEEWGTEKMSDSALHAFMIESGEGGPRRK